MGCSRRRAWTRSLQLELSWRQRFARGSVDDVAVGLEHRAVARAVPGVVGVVPGDGAAFMRAARRQGVQGALLVARQTATGFPSCSITPPLPGAISSRVETFDCVSPPRLNSLEAGRAGS